MIKVNLLPEEFRIIHKDVDHGKYYKYALIGGGLFLLATVFLFIDFLFSYSRYSKIQKEWHVIEPQAQELNDLRSDVEGDLKKEKDFVEQFVVTKRPLTSIMMWCSEILPESAWLTELQLKLDKDTGRLLVKGLALPSKEISSIGIIEKFLQELKRKMPDSSLSLMTTRQQMENTDLTQFTANFSWGEKAEKQKKTAAVKKKK